MFEQGETFSEGLSGWAGGAVLLLGAAALLWDRLLKGRKAHGEPVFTTAAACRQDLRECLNVRGEIQAHSRVDVATGVTAAIKELHVKDGQWVRAGDRLVTLDRERYRRECQRADEELRIAQSELEGVEATWRKAEKTHWRMERLFQEQLLHPEDYRKSSQERDRAALELERCRLGVKRARAEVAHARDAFDQTVIRAPIAGCITGLRAEQGETAVACRPPLAQAVLMVLSRVEELLVEARVGGRTGLKLKPGQPAEVRVDALPGRVFQGRVLEVAPGAGRPEFPSPTETPCSVRILLAADKSGALHLGMTAQVAVLIREVKDALTIPVQAVQERNGPLGVLGLLWGLKPTGLVLKGGKVEARPLRLGITTRQGVEVLEGIRAGERVLTGPSEALGALASGQRVKRVSAK